MIEFNLHFLKALKSDHRGGMEENRLLQWHTQNAHHIYFSSEENGCLSSGES